MKDIKDIEELIDTALGEAIEKHGLTFNSETEAWAVLHEEIEEVTEELDGLIALDAKMWHEIRKDEDIVELSERVYRRVLFLISEALQVGAVARKIDASFRMKGE